MAFAKVTCDAGYDLLTTNLPIRKASGGEEIRYTENDLIKMGFSKDTYSFNQAVCRTTDPKHCTDLKNWGVVQLRTTKTDIIGEYTIDSIQHETLSSVSISERGPGIQSLNFVSCKIAPPKKE